MKLLEMSQLIVIKNALRQSNRITLLVIAVRVSHPTPPEPIHLQPLNPRQTRPIVTAVSGRVIKRAPVHHEARILRDEGPITHIHFILPPARGPIRPVPDGGVQPHLLGRKLLPDGRSPADVADRDAVHVVRDPVRAPQDGVAVEILGRVEPQVVPLLPPALHVPRAVEVGLEGPLAAAGAAEELEVDLVVAGGVLLVVGGVEGDDHAGGVALRQLQRGLEEAPRVHLLGAEAGARRLVHGDLHRALVLVGDDVGLAVEWFERFAECRYR